MEVWNEEDPLFRFGEKEAVIEVAAALGVNEACRELLDQVSDDEREELERIQAIATAVYGRPEQSLRHWKRVDALPAKLDGFCRTAFALGYEGGNMLFESTRDELEKMREFEQRTEFSRAQWLETLYFAFHCGAAAAGKDLSPELDREISTVLFRDVVRAFLAKRQMQDSDVQGAVATVEKMEATTLKVSLLQLLISEHAGIDSEHQAGKSLGQELFAAYHSSFNAKDYAGSSVFNLSTEADLGSQTPIEGIPLVASDLVEDAFDVNHRNSRFRANATTVFAACVRSGFCQDGIAEALLIEDEHQQQEWIRCVLVQFENRYQLQAAWNNHQNCDRNWAN